MTDNQDSGNGDQLSKVGGTNIGIQLMPWLRLMRLPTVFTALSNILCGFLVTHDLRLDELPKQSSLWWLMLASAGLYLGGMVLNDAFDASLDALERPERPIPSGRITRRSALIFGNLLLLIGVLAAAVVGSASLRIALMLTVAVVAYDKLLKNSALGSPGMAACRFLNLMLGASAGNDWSTLWQMPQVGIAAGLALYIFGVTWFARNEAGNSSAGSMWTGLVLAVAGISVYAAVMSVSGFADHATTGAGIVLILVTGNLFMRAGSVIQNPQPVRIQQTVGFMLLSIILLDAAVVFAATGQAGPAALVASLVIPSTLMKRVIPLS